MALDRRFTGKIPRLVGRSWPDVQRELEEFLALVFAEQSGIPAGFLGTNPLNVLVGAVTSPGILQAGWMSASAQLVTAAPASVAGLVNVGVIGVSTTPAREDHAHKRDIRVKVDGVDLATRNALDFRTTGGAVTDDPGNDEVNIPLSSPDAIANAEFLAWVL